MSFIIIWVHLHVWSEGLSVINSLIFSINFNRFSDHFTEIKFNTGLHIIYGESSVGKSKFAHSFYGKNIGNDGNFEILILQSPTNVQFISQNPENHRK